MPNTHDEQQQPVAGPSSRAWLADPNWSVWQYGVASNRYAREDAYTAGLGGGIKRRKTDHEGELKARQDVPTPTTNPEASPPPSPPFDQGTSPTPNSSATDPSSIASPVASAPTESSPSPTQSSSSAPPLFSGSRNDAPDISSSSSSTLLPSDSSPIYTSSSLPWSTRSHSSSSAPAPTFVPGITLNMTLGGDSDTEAVYAVPIELGHGSSARRRKKRAPSATSAQIMNVQIDLGSSDMVSLFFLGQGDQRSTAEQAVVGLWRMHVICMFRLQDAIR